MWRGTVMSQGLISSYYEPGCDEFYYVPGSNKLIQYMRMALV